MAVPFYMAGMEICMNKKKKKFVSYAKWGYIFLIPFFAVYIVFSLIPLISTFYNSFFENYMVGLMQVGPKFVGFDNYKAILFNGDTLLYLKNTMIMWLMGFIPQILISLLLASWFTDLRLRLKCTGFFKTIIYMPNLIMASAFAMLFYAIFADQGPINNMLNSMGLPTYRFLAEVAGARGLIAPPHPKASPHFALPLPAHLQTTPPPVLHRHCCNAEGLTEYIRIPYTCQAPAFRHGVPSILPPPESPYPVSGSVRAH